MGTKILILPSWYPSDASPVLGIFFQEQASVLAESCDVSVLACHVVGWRKILLGRLGPRSGTEERGGLIVRRERALMPLPRVPSLYWPTFAGAAERGFRNLVSTWGMPDIIHAHVVLPAGWAAIILGRKHNIPVVLTEHTGPFSVHLATGLQRRLVRETLLAVDHFIAVSPALMNQIGDFYLPANSSVVGNVIRTSFFGPAYDKAGDQRDSKITFLSIALLTQGKGLEHLLDAARLIIDQGMAGFELIIGGDGPDRSRLEHLAQAQGLANHCHFVGMLTPTEVRHWLQRCDVFVLPTLRETFGVVLGEAMASGKPVISTMSGGPEFIITPETGLLVETANPRQLADAMKQFITGSIRFDAERIRQSVVERFGEQVFLEKITGIYEQVLERS